MTIYKCFKSDFEELQKRINRITKKLDKNNLKWNFNVVGESVESITVWDYSNSEGVPAWQFTPKNKGKITVDVISYTFEMESLKLGNYEVIAVLEHNALGTAENMIHIIKEGVPVPLKYRTIDSICEHCNSHRQRNKTVLLQDEHDNIKQVGSTCIHEYTGIDGIDIISAYQDIHDICITEVYADYEKIEKYPRYENTLEYLAACIQIVKEKGYNKEETKWKAWQISGTEYQDKKYFEIAQKVIDYFKNSTFDESQNFLNNIKIAITGEYTKISGFVAYAILAYEKQIEYEAKKQAERENKKQSEYQGNIGEKIQTELTLKKRIAYETNYTYHGETQYIYIFEDKEGNQYKWNTSKFLEKQEGRYLEPIREGENVTLKGTIKDHEEYKEEKQTVLTRCKIL